MRQDIQILPDNRLFPTVMNINQGQNKLDTALYSMENYVVNEVDLSTCDWYAVLMGVYGLDEVKLTHEVDEGVLKVRWDLNNYVTNIGQTLTYQIVAKNSEAAVYYTNKGIILNSQSIHADEFIVANYPSILRQWEEYMKDLSGISLDAYVIMDLGNYIPPHERVEGKFYINRLTDYDYSCLIEDANGNVIMPSARGVSYDPSNTGILANNVQDAIDNLVKKSKGLNRFCVNEGNLTDGVEDLLDFSDSTLSFKVGGSYPNVIATKADGTTFTRNDITDEVVTDFENGIYNVFLDEQDTELLSNTILTTGQEQVAQFNDILYDPLTFECKKCLPGGMSVTPATAYTTVAITGVTYGRNKYIAVGGSVNAVILTSIDGKNWSDVQYGGASPLGDVIYTGNSFVAVGNDATILRSTDGTNWTKIALGASYTGTLFSIATNGTRIIVGGSSSFTFYSDDDGVTWKSGTRVSNSALGNVRGLAYGNNTFMASTDTGHYFVSTDNGTTWTQYKLGESITMPRIRFINGYFLALSNTGLLWRSGDGINLEQNYVGKSLPFSDVCFYQNYYYCINNMGDIVRSADLQTWEDLPNIGKSLIAAYNNILVGSSGAIYTIDGTTWQQYTKVPVGTVTISNGTIIDVETFPYNYTQYNGLIATPSTFGLMRVAAPEDEVDCSCNDASITPSNLYDLSNYRRANTEYQVNDTVGCPYHHDLELRCMEAGTTSSEAFNTKGTLEIGTSITDGTVTWRIEKFGSGGATITYWE